MNTQDTLGYDPADFVPIAEACKIAGVHCSTLRRNRIAFTAAHVPFKFRYRVRGVDQIPYYYRPDLTWLEQPTPRIIKPGRGRPRKIYAGRCQGNGQGQADAELGSRIKQTVQAQRELTIAG